MDITESKHIEIVDEKSWLNERNKRINSSEVGVLLKYSQHDTYLGVWEKKVNGYEQEENAVMKRGKRSEKFIAESLAEKHGWTIEKLNKYAFNDKYKIGSSFDYIITAPFRALLEIKSVHWSIFNDQWKDGSNIKVPFHYMLQVQQQLMFRDQFRLEKAIIGVARGLDVADMHTVEVQPSQTAEQLILKEVKVFWDMVAKGEAPHPDYGLDFGLLKKQTYNFAPTEGTMDATEDEDKQVRKYALWHGIEKEAKIEKDAAKGKLLELAGKHGRIEGDGYSVSCGHSDEKEEISPPADWHKYVPSDKWITKTTKATRKVGVNLTKKFKIVQENHRGGHQ